MIKFNFCWFSCKLFIRNGIEVMTYVIDESRGDGRAHTHSLRVTINVFFLTKNSNWNEWFLASSEVNFGFKRQFIVFSTCENVDGNFESLGGRFHRNGRIRPIGRLGVTFLIGRLGVNIFGPVINWNVGLFCIIFGLWNYKIPRQWLKWKSALK